MERLQFLVGYLVRHNGDASGFIRAEFSDRVHEAGIVGSEWFCLDKYGALQSKFIGELFVLLDGSLLGGCLSVVRE